MSLFDKLPLKRFKIVNQSMEPLIPEFSEVVTLSYVFFQPKKKDIIVFKNSMPPFIYCKSIERVKKNKVWVVSENKEEGIDSSTLGYVDTRDIVGKVILKLS